MVVFQRSQVLLLLPHDYSCDYKLCAVECATSTAYAVVECATIVQFQRNELMHVYFAVDSALAYCTAQWLTCILSAAVDALLHCTAHTVDNGDFTWFEDIGYSNANYGGTVVMQTSLMRGKRTPTHRAKNFWRVNVQRVPAEPVPNLPPCTECTQTLGSDGRRELLFNCLNFTVI
jgi:hypothetical protein